ncbi:MAG: hypothetical protein P1U53_00395 [Sulfitobacter sp.]|nr:hypothetical protein [Sulfitobacter sp.]
MRGVALGFVLAGVCAGLLGMVWGIQMAASQDHGLSPAHGHLNLVGWVSLTLFGLYYHTVPVAAASRLARLHLALAILGVILLVPGIVMARQGGTEAIAILGSFVSLGSMLTFLVVVIRSRLTV